MAVKVFLTGATGYIGGDILYAIHKAHPDFELALLVRKPEQGDVILKEYPNARIVIGDLDSSDVIEKEAAAADIVVHTADSSDHVPSATAIAKGLAAGHSAERPGYWIHICGTGILMWYDETHKRFGEPPLPTEKYDDIADINRILTLPDTAFHRPVDKIVQAAAAAHPASIKPAIVGPPTIYGAGRGPLNRRSRQVYSMAQYTLEKGFAPVVGTGLTEWDNIHIADVSDLVVRLVDAALDPARRGDPELFGERAYFFAENGAAHRWGEVAAWIAEEAKRQGFLAEAVTRVVDPGTLRDRSWGLNSKSVATRARRFLGWEARGRSLREEIPEVVRGEAESLGLKAGQ